MYIYYSYMSICYYTISILGICEKITYSYKYNNNEYLVKSTYILSSICFSNKSKAIISFRLLCRCSFSRAIFLIMSIS